MELWIKLSRSNWSSIVLVPADPGGSTAPLARALAETGQRLSFYQVTAVTLSALEFGSALALADLAQHAQHEQRTRIAQAAAAANGEAAAAAGADPAGAAKTEALARTPPTQLIIAIPSVISEPLGIPAAQQADAVVVTIRVGQTLTSQVKRTVELVGRERVAGCVLLR